jgi:hypothetical protein
MSTVQVSSGEATVAMPQQPACQFNGNGPPRHCRRKMKRVCCCLTVLLVLNVLISLFTVAKMNELLWLFRSDSDMVLMPGGTSSFCNDFCVDLCVTNTKTMYACDLLSCLSSCESHFSPDEQEMVIHIEYDEYYDDTNNDAGRGSDVIYDTETETDYAYYPTDDSNVVHVDTPPYPEYDDSDAVDTQMEPVPEANP